MPEVPDRQTSIGSACCREARTSTAVSIGLPSPTSCMMHRQLHWLDIRSRVRFKIGLLVFKCLHGLAPRYLRLTASRCQYRSLAPPCVQPGSKSVFSIVPRTRTKTIGPRGFFESMRRPLSGIRSLTICAILNSQLVVLGTN